MERLHTFIRPIPNFPQPGVVFRDITPLLADPSAMRLAVHRLVDPFLGERVDMVAGMEARGFIFGALCAQELSAGFVPLRKPGKLPHHTESVSYALEYGENALEVHVDALGHGHRVLLVDDLIATGGTAAASCALVERLGGSVVGCSFLIELDALEGRKALHGQRVHSVLHF
jgi:adenine phosphoribosyltransferase